MAPSTPIRQGFSVIALLTFGALLVDRRSLLVVGVHYRMFDSIPGFYPLENSSTSSPRVVTVKKKCFQILPNVSWEATSLLIDTGVEDTVSFLLFPENRAIGPKNHFPQEFVDSGFQSHIA